METIQLRISNKRFFVVPKTFLSFFPGFFVSPIFWSFLVPLSVFSTPQKQQTKNARTSKRHAKICCAQNFYGDYYYYY